MITELNVVPSEIVGGAKINVVNYSIRNYRLHQVLEQISRMFLFCLECDSNNTNSKVTPRDSRNILSQWQIAKDEFQFSIEHNDFPSGNHEYAFSIFLPDQKEIQRVRNVKMKRVISEMFNTCRVMLSVDSAKTQGSVSTEDIADIKLMFNLVDDCLERWIGTGEDHEKVGVNVPAYENLGQITPDVDSDYARIMEPSKSSPLPKLPDTPDTV